VHQNALPVIHVPHAAQLQRGCAGAIAVVAGLLGVGGALAGLVAAYVASSAASAVVPPAFNASPGAKPAVAADQPADEPTGALVEEDYFANANLAKARYEKVLGKPIMARTFTLMQYYATLEAQDPKNHEHIDSYKLWANKVERPQPVRLGGDKAQIAQLVFSLEGIDFGVVPKLIKQALGDLKLEEGKVAVVTLDRDAQGAKHEPIWRVVVNGSRENGVVEFSVTGEKLRQF
jgi:hypothetical protein